MASGAERKVSLRMVQVRKAGFGFKVGSIEKWESLLPVTSGFGLTDVRQIPRIQALPWMAAGYWVQVSQRDQLCSPTETAITGPDFSGQRSTLRRTTEVMLSTSHVVAQHLAPWVQV